MPSIVVPLVVVVSCIVGYLTVTASTRWLLHWPRPLLNMPVGRECDAPSSDERNSSPASRECGAAWPDDEQSDEDCVATEQSINDADRDAKGHCQNRQSTR